MSGTLESDFRFDDGESTRLRTILLGVVSNPYRRYAGFRKEIQALVADSRIPARFADFCAVVARRDMVRRPVIVVENCPLDLELPVFGSEDPVADKYRMKRTSVAEGFLALYSELTGVHPIGHATVNNGDFFHDVYPKRSMFDTQSQKGLGTLRFHRDFTNHPASPQQVSQLMLRDAPGNRVLSAFATVATALRELDPTQRRALSQPRFTTPVDHILTAGGDDTAEDHHAVIAQDGTPHVLEGRTRGVDEEAHSALGAFLAALHRNQVTRESRPGDLLTFSNDHVMHGRLVQELANPASMRTRWLIKTHNVNRLDDYLDLFVPGRPGVVA